MKLIGSPSSPYVRKVRIVMAEKKLDYQFEIENVYSEHATIQNFNPLGKIPCLVMEDGGALFDSRVIVEYVDTLSPVTRLIPQGGRERAMVKVWEAISDGVLDAGMAILLENERPAEQRSQAWIDRQHSKILASLSNMDASLANQTAYCTGVNYSLADIAVGCALGYLDLRFGDIDWRSQHANLARLEEKLATRPSFVDTRVRA